MVQRSSFSSSETQHTLKEVKSWLDEISFELVPTSINNYQSLKNTNMEELYDFEKGLEKVSFEKNRFEHKFSQVFLLFISKKLIKPFG